jgi:hypothetical protein
MSEANKQLVRRHFEELFNSNNDAVADELVARSTWSTRSRRLGRPSPARSTAPHTCGRPPSGCWRSSPTCT